MIAELSRSTERISFDWTSLDRRKEKIVIATGYTSAEWIKGVDRFSWGRG